MDDEILDDLVEIFVETLTGSCIAIECYNSDTVQFLKQRVWEYEGNDGFCNLFVVKYRYYELASSHVFALNLI